MKSLFLQPSACAPEGSSVTFTSYAVTRQAFCSFMRLPSCNLEIPLALNLG